MAKWSEQTPAINRPCCIHLSALVSLWPAYFTDVCINKYHSIGDGGLSKGNFTFQYIVTMLKSLSEEPSSVRSQNCLTVNSGINLILCSNTHKEGVKLYLFAHQICLFHPKAIGSIRWKFIWATNGCNFIARNVVRTSSLYQKIQRGLLTWLVNNVVTCLSRRMKKESLAPLPISLAHARHKVLSKGQILTRTQILKIKIK